MPDTTAIYLDYNATTPVDPVVLQAMLPYFSDLFANASSRSHVMGRTIGEKIEASRRTVADFLGCETSEIVFTGGSTESINMAIKGVAAAYKSRGQHLITWDTEHKAVLDVCEKLAEAGFEITQLPVDREGLPDPVLYRNSLRKDTILTIMMLANNETGVINPVREISEICHEHNSLIFCDATQGPGKMQVNVNDLGVDLLCISAHKMYGPKGTGALFIRRKNPRVTLIPIIDGGGHENGLRSGTLNVPGIIGLAKACEIAASGYWENTSGISALRTLLEQQLTTNGIGYVNGSIKNRLPNTSNILFPGIKADQLLIKLPGLAVSTGSACSSALPEPSHVLKAMGRNNEEAFASVRFSLGKETTREQIAAAADMILQQLK
ncbi:MAG: cysteine desulfurase [Bacteroidota bacterium]|nr:cysteine desulfurase [Bacteroidota bacterium]